MGAVTVIGAAAVQNESRPAWMGAVIRGGQHVADALGIPAHLTTMDPDTAFGVIAMPVLLAVILLGVQAGSIARAVTSRDFWDDTGRLLGVAQLLLLVLAYALGTGGQSRSFGAAVGDILSGQLPDLLPMAVATQWLLLSILWLVVGASAGVRRSDLTAPFDHPHGDDPGRDGSGDRPRPAVLHHRTANRPTPRDHRSRSPRRPGAAGAVCRRAGPRKKSRPPAPPVTDQPAVRETHPLALRLQQGRRQRRRKETSRNHHRHRPQLTTANGP
ncbi:hypothetical protein [Kitasatospora purpeofusca]|uniref:hypothetical protein n=1 Tax=Kitasatospora purpeofusca TaxID=67352 RepID=UPI002253BB60|nr:hypothetical protein [Kitasatospora purpeofusca]MCX4758414.1 hypothetical protein [Kitasatospora purpeofusca]WSR31134.1 hypothetical protein OG715_09180 [Kitasatospora purpeofusca]WSR39170.1 hypothetical protein OG196_08695 [Kitasatospora purpeofusca]